MSVFQSGLLAGDHFLTPGRYVWTLRGGAKSLKLALERAIRLVAPSVLVGPLLRGFAEDKDTAHSSDDENTHSVVPSKTTINRNEFSLDIAMILWRRRKYLEDGPCARYLWTDASPVAGYNWFWAQIHEIPVSRLVSVWKSANTLALAAHDFAMHVNLSDEDAIMARPADWIPDLENLKLISEHIFAPTTLGSGHTSGANKVGCMLHQWNLELPPSVALRDHSCTFVSHTSDMGVEMSSTHFSVENIDDLLPDWVNRGDLRQELVDDNAAIAQEGRSESPYEKCFLPKALGIYGIQHLVSNLNQDVHTVLRFWPTFWKQMKNIEALLRTGDRRRRFQWRCMMRTPYQCHMWKLDKWSHTLYEERWKNVVTFLKHLQPLLEIFRACWNIHKYQQGGDAEAGAGAEDGAGGDPGNAGGNAEYYAQFDARLFSDTIDSHLFHRYVDFIWQTDMIPQD